MRLILVGQGELVYYLTRQFAARRYRCAIVTPDPGEAAELARRLDATLLVGDGTDMQVLENAGARRADAVLALTGNDADNLAICQLAGGMFQVPRTIALVNDPDNEEVFHRLNVSVAISATRILSTILQEETGFEQIAELMPLAAGKIAVAEVTLHASAPAVDQPLHQLALPVNALIGGIIRRGEVIVPRGSTRLQAGDRLILIATRECFETALKLFAGEPE